MKGKMYIYYDTESDYLEIRFGEPTESYYKKIGPDTYVRIDEKTGEKKGYAIFNVQKSSSPLKAIEVEIPINVLKLLKEESQKLAA